ncbi:hypothetical protein [Geobacter sp. AOG2]|uniref:hypothetical protein n=1 Tax=Geobacter sp. AOG2 TaxID=1566347 RepID=UPI001CC6EE8D|nr:hypothetical protein [Geobacter sp. AOG2]GFE60374.1 hypothetical protein AOG2_09620 [Geobacter sp. AOG2]
MQKILLRDSLPDFAHELEHLLLMVDRPELACLVENMKVDMDRCVSGEESCAMLCTGLQPSKGWGVGQTTIVLTPARGNILVDVIEGDIIAVEVFFRKDVQDKLLQLRHSLENSPNEPESVPCGTASVVMCHGNG